MGKTLWGIDLDESPAGGLIERLLSEEELEALTDGGRDDREEADETDDEDEADDVDVEVEADDLDVEVEREDDGGFDVDVETDDEDVEIDVDVDDGEVDVDVGRRGASMFDADAESERDESGGLRDRFPSLGDEDATDAGDETADADEDESGGLVAKVRPHLLKVALVGAVLAVVAVLAWRYLGTIRSVADDKLGRGGDDDETDDVTEVSVDDDDDAPAARRRAKGLADADPLSEAESPDEDDAATGERDDDDDGVAAPGGSGDSDMGALLGLAFLALVAAVVRKFTEEREHDPLVDGPE